MSFACLHIDWIFKKRLLCENMGRANISSLTVNMNCKKYIFLLLCIITKKTYKSLRMYILD